jgi:hypothetical protein
MVEQHTRIKRRDCGEEIMAETKKPTPKPTPKVTKKPTPKPTPSKPSSPNLGNRPKGTTVTKNPVYNPSMDIPPIGLPGFNNRGVAAAEAYGWFKLVAAKSAKGTPARKAYDAFTARLTALGIPKSKWDSVWKDAVDWTQTVGSNPTLNKNGMADPSGYLGILDPSDYAGSSTGPKYGTSINKQISTTQYSPSQAGSTVNRYIESEVGRTATKEEVDAYLSGVNAAAKASPTITSQKVTTTQGKGNLVPAGAKAGAKATSPNLGSTVTESMTSGEFDPSMYALNFARSRPDFAESFATKTVLGLINRILKDPNAIGEVVQ